ncbi:MAG TPA: HAD family hydrolase [Myxococcota bacterium]|nr:HAD family hydrolase [Myxococcota bacterium]
MKPPKALLLDLDETLLDGRGLARAIQGTCERLAASHSSLDAARLRAANAEVWEAYFPGVEPYWVLGQLDGASLVREAWRRTLAACGTSDESLLRLASQTHHELSAREHRLFDDAVELLARAKRVGLPLALITNGASDTQREKLRVLELEPWFGAIVVSGELGIAKPDPAGFRRALQQLGVAPADAWHVGDSLADDVAGARATGMTGIWLNRAGRPRRPDQPEPHLEIGSLRDLGPFLPE